MWVRLSRVRFTIRGAMVAVVVVATILAIGAGLERRKERFERLSGHHMAQSESGSILTFSDEGPTFVTERGLWHYHMARKYAEAARYPWLPVAPDPPPPD